MAYQNVGTPRFYINIPEWLVSSGETLTPAISDIYRTLPVGYYGVVTGTNTIPSAIVFTPPDSVIAVI